MYYSTKTYGHDRGFSCCFRQWRADSHCKFLHGYSLGFKFVFGSPVLDSRNWVVDFGGFKDLKEELEFWFDHTLIVAKDDPELNSFSLLKDHNLAQVRILDNVGCEAFAETAYNLAEAWLNKNYGKSTKISLIQVEVSEHQGNSAIYKVDNDF